jgi:hypothetical protein
MKVYIKNGVRGTYTVSTPWRRPTTARRWHRDERWVVEVDHTPQAGVKIDRGGKVRPVSHESGIPSFGDEDEE